MEPAPPEPRSTSRSSASVGRPQSGPALERSRSAVLAERFFNLDSDSDAESGLYYLDSEEDRVRAVNERVQERRPLLDAEPGRGNTRFQNRERFNRNQRTQAQRLLERAPISLCCLCVFVVAFLTLGVVLYVAGWYVWWKHGSKPCDQPLATWLLLMQCTPLVQLVVDYLIYSAWVDKAVRLIFHGLRSCLIVLGFYWYIQSKTCAKTNPLLFGFVWHYLLYLLTIYLLMIVVPTVVLGLMIWGMSRGWFDESGVGSRDPRETLNGIETISYATFREMVENEQDKPDEECPCCWEQFDTNALIKRTPCGHVFHEECLAKWLKVSTTCPICRNDLEEAVNADKAKNASLSEEV